MIGAVLALALAAPAAAQVTPEALKARYADVRKLTAQVVQVPMEGRTWFRVQVGRYGTRAEAEQYYQKKLRPKGIEGFVTQK